MKIRERAKRVAVLTQQASALPLVPAPVKAALSEVTVFVLECADAIEALQQKGEKHDHGNG